MLDTNVVSELMRSAPSEAVLGWFSYQTSTALFVSSVSEAELRTGVAILPEGKRQRMLARAVEDVLARDFADRILPFNSAAARVYPLIAVARRRTGRPILEGDCQIAAIARSHGAALATRNIADFEGCGIDLINPWLWSPTQP